MIPVPVTSPRKPVSPRDDTSARAGLPVWLSLRTDLVWPATRSLLAELPADLRRAATQTRRLLTVRAVADPPLLLLDILRRWAPRLRLAELTVVTRAAEVRAALTDGQHRVPYGATMDDVLGAFALGQDGPDHARSRARLDRLVADIDSAAVAQWADQAAGLLVRQSLADGRIDVVGEFAAPLVGAFVERYLGIAGREPASDPVSGPATLLELNRASDLLPLTAAVFEACFLNFAEPPDRGVSERGTGAADTLAGRCPHASSSSKRSEKDSETIDLVGMAVGAVPTVVEAATRVIDVLLERPDALTRARDAAGRGERDVLWNVVREALRFSPQSPALLRLRDGVPGRILLSTLAAMHDPAVVTEPGRFAVDRDDSIYLHFGAGPHRCVGEPLARELLVSLTAVLVSQPGLARLPGQRGRLVWDGPVPRRLLVSLCG